MILRRSKVPLHSMNSFCKAPQISGKTAQLGTRKVNPETVCKSMVKRREWHLTFRISGIVAGVPRARASTDTDKAQHIFY